MLEGLTEKPFAIQNSTHFCGFFDTREQAEEHLKGCQRIRESSYGVYFYGSPNQPCTICTRKDLERYEKPSRATFPFGYPDGRVNHDISVITYLDYLKI